MVQFCSRCHRANPDAAVFCHHDGFMLRQGGADAAGAGQLLQEFIFPSGRRCRTFDELVQGCYNEWEDARTLLADGTFASFLAGLGRADLARAAREAQAVPDRDIGLTNFVTALPATLAQGPKLGLNPRRLSIGPMRVGEQRRVQVKVLNEGQGLLQGKLTVADAAGWLRVVDGEDATTYPVKTGREEVILLDVDTARLTVGQHYMARLVVVTNGGVAELPIRLDLVVRPFNQAPFTGVVDPRDLARRMLKQIDRAVPLLENGDIQRWFEANGWTYPIVGATAPGRAAVQQFFEGLGLAKPPPIAISDQEVRLSCSPAQTIRRQVSIRTPARRIVYARAESDSPWLRVSTPSVVGEMQAEIGFEVDAGQMPQDRTYLGNLRVIANAGQTFTVRVQVEIQGNRRSGPAWGSGPVAAVPPPPPPPAPVPAPAPAWLPVPAPAPAPAAALAAPPAGPILTPLQPATGTPPAVAPAVPLRAATRGGVGKAIFLGALLGLLGRLALIVPADLWARLLGAPDGLPRPGSVQAWAMAPPADEGFLRLFVLATWWLGAVAGVILVWQRGGRLADLVCGLIAGSVAGVAGSATLACLLVLGDTVPRLLLSGLTGVDLHPALATPVWLITAVVWWLVAGAGVGFVLGLLGRTGLTLLSLLASPLAWVLRLVGLVRAADFFDLRG